MASMTGGSGGSTRAVAQYSGAPLGADEQRPPTAGDPALLIYTSGTTGLPKAAYVTHARIMAWSGWFSAMLDMRADDRLYDCLPLYHSVGGVVAVGSMLMAGGAVVIREPFLSEPVLGGRGGDRLHPGAV